MPRTIRLTVFAFAALLLVAVAGCGDPKEKDKPVVTPPQLSGDIKLTIVPSGPKFNKSTAEAKEGTVKLTVTNPQDSGSKHGIGIDGGEYKNVEGQPVAPGRSTSLTVNLKPGKYEYYDPYKNFRKEGVTGTLTVTKK